MALSFRTRLIWVLLLGISLLGACSSTAKNKINLPEAELIEQGRIALAKERFTKASRYFEDAITTYPFGENIEQSKLDLAYAYFGAGEQEKSIDAVNLFLRTHPQSRYVPYAYYIRGLANYDYGKSSMFERWFPRDLAQRDADTMIEAMKDFSIVVDRYSSSKYAADSQKRLAYLLDQQVEREIQIAEVEMNKGNAIGARARLNRIMQVRPDNNYKQRIDALYAELQ